MSKKRPKSLPWELEFRIAKAVLEPFGGVLERVTFDYEVFRFKALGVAIIFYPHKVKTTGNVHIRVRDANSKNQRLANEIMMRLDLGVYGCTFSRKNDFGSINTHSDFANQQQINRGWAEDLAREQMKAEGLL